MDYDCCPYCKHNFPEDYANELCPLEEGEWKCAGCGERFAVRIQPAITVETWKKEEKS